MQDLAYYQNVGAYPKKEDFTTYFAYQKGKVVHANVPGAEGQEKEYGWKVQGYTVEKQVDENGYRAARDAYRTKERSLLNEFRDDLLAANGLTAGNPKAIKAYDIAWNERHSNGLGEVVDLFEDLAQLLK